MQAFLTIDSAQSLVVRSKLLTAEEYLKSSPTKARPLLRKLTQRRPNLSIFVEPLRSVLHRPPRTADESACRSLAQSELLQSLHRFFAL